jgi:hypothetical protein
MHARNVVAGPRRSPYLISNRGRVVREEFEEFNVFVYYSLLNGLLDFLLWCLEPIIDDQREYSVPRMYLAAATRGICRIWLRHTGVIADKS